MINLLKTVWTVIRKYKKTSLLAAILIFGFGFYLLSQSGDDLDGKKIAVAKTGDVVQEVSVTGRVKSSQAVDLAFNVSGRIVSLNVKSGSRVGAGQTLASLDASDLSAQRQREIALVNAAQNRLDQLLATTDVNQPTDNSAIADTLSKALKVSIDAMVDYTTVQYKYFGSYSSRDNQIAQAKEEIMKLIYSQSQLGRVGSWYFLNLNTGLKSKISDALINPETADYEVLVNDVRNVLLETRQALELVNIQLSDSANQSQADIDLINANIDSVITQASALTTQKKDIVSDVYEINVVREQLEQAKASLALVEAQMAKYRLVAPFAGVATNIDVRAGEIVSPNQVVVSLIGNAKFQIEANISEADIAKIKVGNDAKVTLDAYGKDIVFEAKVAHIDPAGRIVDGVASYKVTFEFTQNDGRILSGLTADVDVATNKKENVLYVASRDVINEDGNKFINVLIKAGADDTRFANLSVATQTDEYKIVKVPVTTGLRGSDGRTEILSGLKEGDQIVSD